MLTQKNNMRNQQKKNNYINKLTRQYFIFKKMIIRKNNESRMTSKS